MKTYVRVASTVVQQIQAWEEGDPSPAQDGALTTLELFQIALGVVAKHPEAAVTLEYRFAQYAEEHGWKP